MSLVGELGDLHYRSRSTWCITNQQDFGGDTHWSRSSSGAFGTQSRPTKSFAKFGKGILDHVREECSVKWIGINNVKQPGRKARQKHDDAAASGASQQIIKMIHLRFALLFLSKPSWWILLRETNHFFPSFRLAFPSFSEKRLAFPSLKMRRGISP